MISLREACIKVRDSHPGQYIHVANEFADTHAFVLLDEGTAIRDYSIICGYTTVDKRTGEMADDVAPFLPEFDGRYRHYTKEDIAALLR